MPAPLQALLCNGVEDFFENINWEVIEKNYADASQ